MSENWPRWAQPLDASLSPKLVETPDEWAQLPPGYGTPEDVKRWEAEGTKPEDATSGIPSEPEPPPLGEADRLKTENQALREAVDELTERLSRVTAENEVLKQTVDAMQAAAQGAADGNGEGAGSSSPPKGRRPRGRRTARAK